MRRVYTVRVLRPLFSGFTAGCVVLTVTLYILGREVWVARILQNMPRSGDIVAIGNFYLAAFSHTNLIIQALTLFAAASAVYLARETVRTLSSAFTPLRT